METEFIEDRDLYTIDTWHKARGGSLVPRDFLPTVGYWIRGKAAGWLYLTDATSVAFIDQFVTNPSAEVGERREAVTLVAAELLHQARVAGVRQVIALTQVPSIIDIATKLGFQSYGDNFHLMRRAV